MTIYNSLLQPIDLMIWMGGEMHRGVMLICNDLKNIALLGDGSINPKKYLLNKLHSGTQIWVHASPMSIIS